MQLTLNTVKYRPMNAPGRAGVSAQPRTALSAARRRTAGKRLPPHVYFLVSAVFHYLGPALAVLLFAQIAPLGVAWLRIASAAVVFTLWRRPARLWRLWRVSPARARRLLVTFGIVLAAMNACFYLAIARIPLATVGAMEFLGPVLLAALGTRTRRNAAALALVMAAIVISPAAIAAAAAAFTRPLLLGAGCGVGICSSVIPYVTDQLAMARLPRTAFALLMSLLPASATIIGVIVLHQLPGRDEIIGIALVAAGVAVRAEPAG